MPEPVHMMTKPLLVLLIGQAGSGHSTALGCLEDAGYTAVDNLPMALVDQLVALIVETQARPLALSIDIRTSGFDLAAASRLIGNLKDRLGEQCQVICISADNAEILRRYQATRRRHPLIDNSDNLEHAISSDHHGVADLARLADIEIESTTMTPVQLRTNLRASLGLETHDKSPVHIISFSYRKGVPLRADFLFDMRFLNNPHWQPALRMHTGLDPQIQEFIAKDTLFLPFMTQACDMLLAILPPLQTDGRTQMTIGFGCTGGKHRSVTAAEWLTKKMRESEIDTYILHRDLG